MRLDRVVPGNVKLVLDLAPVVVVVADTITMEHWQRFFWDPAAAVAAVTTVVVPEQPVVAVAVSSSSSLMRLAFQGQGLFQAKALLAPLLRMARPDRVVEERADRF